MKRGFCTDGKWGICRNVSVFSCSLYITFKLHTHGAGQIYTYFVSGPLYNARLVYFILKCPFLLDLKMWSLNLEQFIKVESYKGWKRLPSKESNQCSLLWHFAADIKAKRDDWRKSKYY